MIQSVSTCQKLGKGEALKKRRYSVPRPKKTVSAEEDPETLQNFWSAIDKNGREPQTIIYKDLQGPCWRWKKCLNKAGYGRIGGVNRMLAHRFSWLIHYGKIPDGMEVCHKCNNPECVRPDHLYVGTHGDNVRQSIVEGRLVRDRGEQHSVSVLTEEIVVSLRRLYSSGNSTTELSATFGLDAGTIYQCIVGKTWKHVPGSVKARTIQEARNLRMLKKHVSTRTGPSQSSTSTRQEPSPAMP